VATTKNAKAFVTDAGPYREFGCLTKDTNSSGTVVIFTLAVANTKTDTLYLLIFESPESDWDAAWKLGKEMVDKVPLQETI
jgi:hypothetical protein